MPSTLRRNLHLCFTKIKRPLESESPSSLHHTRPLVVKNFNTLFDYTLDKSPAPSSSSEPDFATVIASQRFFFSSPGRSNSIIESTQPSNIPTPTETETSSASSETESWNSLATVKDSVAVPTYSPDPYLDFRRSMQEMVEARDLMDVKANWDYLHELLLCYLALNPKSTHKYIVRAFADLLVSLLALPSPPPQEEGE